MILSPNLPRLDFYKKVDGYTRLRVILEEYVGKN